MDYTLLDRWSDAGRPPVESWLRRSSNYGQAKPALPPSELRHQHALTKAQAGLLLGGMSEDWIQKHVLPHAKTIRSSRSVLILADDLQRWAHEDAAHAVPHG